MAGMDPFAAYTDHRLTRPTGRVVAWTQWGEPGGLPMLRVPGTPGCRWAVRADTTPWAERGLRVITTERPGFGASTPLPGRGFLEHADDLAAILDHLGIAQVHMIGGSGSAPHELAFAQQYPDRVRAATILVGAAPLEENEIDSMIPLNQQSHRLCRAGDREGEAALLGPGPAPASRHAVVAAMTDYAAEQAQHGVPARAVARHMLGLFNGLPGARAWRRRLATADPGEGPDLLRTAAALVAMDEREVLGAA